MPTRFYSGVYEPEMVETMGRAFDSAWSDFAPQPANKDLARSLMATAIIDAVELGARDHDNLVRRATVALMIAIKADPKALGQAASRMDRAKPSRRRSPRPSRAMTNE
jgi:hypothetical protein